MISSLYESYFNEIVFYLLKYLKTDFIREDNTSLLMFACYYGTREVVEEVFKISNDINKVNDFGMFPLLLGAYSYRTDVVQFLLNNGADPTMIDSVDEKYLEPIFNSEIRKMLDIN